MLMAGLAFVAAAASCADHPMAPRLETLAQSEFVIADATDREAVMRVLITCADDPDPFWRDTIGYSGLSAILRRDPIAPDTMQFLTAQVQSEMKRRIGSDTFAAAFLPLYLSEIIRVDRLDPFLTPEDRSLIAETVAQYLEAISDYRGFVEGEGWRHQVAHAADAALQLALNPLASDAIRGRLRDALLNQVAPSSGHFYVFGEPERLARAFVYNVNASALPEDGIVGMLGSLAEPGPAGSWENAYQSTAKLARLHNTKAFLSAVIVALAEQDDPKLSALRVEALSVHRALP